jgi:hypothetical protein
MPDQSLVYFLAHSHPHCDQIFQENRKKIEAAVKRNEGHAVVQAVTKIAKDVTGHSSIQLVKLSLVTVHRFDRIYALAERDLFDAIREYLADDHTLLPYTCPVPTDSLGSSKSK